MEKLLIAYYQITSVLLFLIGFYILIITPNLIKKILGLNIMETGAFLLLISSNKVHGGVTAPIFSGGVVHGFANPLPQHMVILGVLMTLGLNSFALILIIKIFDRYRTLNCSKLRRLI